MGIAAILVTIMLTWQWGRGALAGAFYAFGVQSGKKVAWLVALRDMVDEIRISIEENLPQARALVQGRRRLVESDRAFVFLCSRPSAKPRRVPSGVAPHLPQEVRGAPGPRHLVPRQPDLGGRDARATGGSR